MFTLPGYTIEKEIYRSADTLVVCGKRKTDNLSVVIKFLNREYPSEREVSRFASEYELTRSLEGPGVLKVYGLVAVNNSLAMILEDMGGIPLAEAIASSELGLQENLILAVGITDVLARMHEKKIIHKDINPWNILYNRENGEIRIIDFGLSTQLKRENPQKMKSDVFEGTLDYVSPEQTGRMNRAVDSRSDLYSLGMTLYEMFTGKLPFVWRDVNEIVYCHIAKEPQPPKQVNPEIPAVLSDIILKLIAKNAEDRYQTVQGLKYDLEYCLKTLQPQGEITGFLIGKNDFSSRFQIPERLYGRDEELARLKHIFADTTDGNSCVVMIEGPGGGGKSSLINELFSSIAEKRGFFISGKFDQLESNNPFSALTDALSGLMSSILSKPESALESWKNRILEVLSQNAQVILDILPDLERIIGPQPQPPLLQPLEAQNRFLMILRDFIALFASSETPLVIFLDDLQWSDLSTIEFIKYFYTNDPVPYVLLIGAYRGNEVSTDHPLNLMLEYFAKNERPFEKLTITSLKENDINLLLADIFACSSRKTKKLAAMVNRKTKGNPFYTRQFLISLYDRDVFLFNSVTGEWTWDQAVIEGMDATRNVVELLEEHIEQLPARTLDVLKTASCIGNHFDVNHLSRICNTSLLDIGRILWPAVEGEYIFPQDNNYRILRLQEWERPLSSVDIGFSFQHDRIHQVVYSLIPEKEKWAIHLEIGRLYSQDMNDKDDSEFIFDMVNHLNISSPLIRNKSERQKLMNENIAAGQKAMRSTAFPSALHYFGKALDILSDKEWEEIPEQRFDLLLKKGEALFLTGNLSNAEQLCSELSKYAETDYDRGLVYHLRARILEFQARFPEAVEDIRQGLSLFGIRLPLDQEEIQAGIGEGIMKMQQGFARVPVEEVKNLPVMTDRNRVLAMELLFQVIPPALQINPALYILSALLMLDQTLEFGITPVSSKCLCDCGIIQATTLGDYNRAYQLGQASFALIDKFKAEALKPSVYFGFTFISTLCVHFQESLDYYDLSYKLGLETGDLQHAAYAISHKLHMCMYAGESLSDCLTDSNKASLFIGKIHAFMPNLLTRIIRHFIDKFRSDPEKDDIADLTGKDKALLSEIEAFKNIPFMQRFALYNTFYSYFHRDMEEAEHWSRVSEELISAALMDFPVPDHYLFRSLILIKKWNSLTAEQQVEGKEIISAAIENLKKRSDNCPANFAHKHLFLLAEWGTVQGEPLETVLDLYQRALKSIGENDFQHMRALINEARAGFWMQRGEEIIARAYLREAYFWYQHWGALRKTKLMEKEYPGLLLNKEKNEKNPLKSIGGSRSVSSDMLDIASILKSTQSINSEIRLDRLLEHLMAILVQNTGAQLGSLLLVNVSDGELYQEAEKTPESEKIMVLQSKPYLECPCLSPEIIRYVHNSLESIVLRNASEEGDFKHSAYIRKHRIRSLMCVPVMFQNQLKGMVYLENNLAEGVFTESRLELVRILASQASISIDNARLYENLEEKVRQRTMQLKAANDRLKDLSLLDPLTNLHNRRYIQEFVSETSLNFIKNKLRLINSKDMRGVSLNTKVMGVFLIDLDYFKNVNDNYGHAAGDKVLVGIAGLLKKLIRIDDFVVRWGGEEFLIILNNTDFVYLNQFANKILKTVKETPIEVQENQWVSNTCSVGCTTIPMNNFFPELLNLEQTINICDYALYLAKEGGRNSAVLIKAKEGTSMGDEFRDYLRRMNKNTKVNEDFIELEVIT